MKSRFTTVFISISIGLVYLWFGMLKFFPDLSPAEDLAKNTIHGLTFGLVPDGMSILLLAGMEVVIGLLLLIGIFPKTTIYIALFHMVCTFTPLVFFSEQTFNEGPLYLTLLGQYIIKNLIIVAALLVLYERRTSAVLFSKNRRWIPLKLTIFKFNLQKLLSRNLPSLSKNVRQPTD